MISILMVTHNAPRYVWKSLRGIRKRTQDVEYEVVVVDNDSRLPTRLIVVAARFLGLANRVALLDRNTLFAEGCNIAAAMGPRESTHVLLLNSDTEPKAPNWLSNLLQLHRRGAVAYGFVEKGPVPRADGYCLLVDRDLFMEIGLDESFQWWWSVTRLQAELLKRGHSVRAVRDHDEWLVHYRGRSGKDWKGARGMKTPAAQIQGWFEGHQVTLLDDAVAGTGAEPTPAGVDAP
jgi:GT2 family glycosyltransferase